MKSRSQQQIAQTASIHHALGQRRKVDRQKGNHFKEETPDTISRRLAKFKAKISSNAVALSKQSGMIGGASMDPFETLSVSAARLTELLSFRTSLSAGAPVFNIGQVCYQALHDIFGMVLNDGAVAAALGLTLVLAANQWQSNLESDQYESITIQHLSQELACPQVVHKSSTFGIVMLLLGNEVSSGTV